MRIFASFKNVNAFYTDKNDGNFADYVDDDEKELLARRKSFAAGRSIALLKQVHGDVVLGIKECGRFECVGEADGMTTNVPGITLAIQTADCAGVLLYDPKNNAIGALHAGRKGAELNILSKCVAKMQNDYSTNPSELIVYVGAHIKGCCYELPKETADGFISYPKAVSERDGKSYLDIGKVIYAQALKLGIKDKNIEISELCTSCNSEKFFSYRAESGKCGRMLTAIGLNRF